MRFSARLIRRLVCVSTAVHAAAVITLAPAIPAFLLAQPAQTTIRFALDARAEEPRHNRAETDRAQEARRAGYGRCCAGVALIREAQWHRCNESERGDDRDSAACPDACGRPDRRRRRSLLSPLHRLERSRRSR